MHNYSGKFRKGDVYHSGDMVEVMCTGTGTVRSSPGTTGKMSLGDRSKAKFCWRCSYLLCRVEVRKTFSHQDQLRPCLAKSSLGNGRGEGRGGKYVSGAFIQIISSLLMISSAGLTSKSQTYHMATWICTFPNTSKYSPAWHSPT